MTVRKVSRRMVHRLARGVAAAAVLAGAHAPAQAASEYFVQVAALKSEEQAQAEWARLQRAQPDLLGDLQPTLQSVDLGDRGVFYRVRIGPFPNRATAADMCWQLQEAQLRCLVVRSQ